MTASAALILSVVMIVLFGLAGIVAGVIWRRRGYRMPVAVGVAGLVLIFLGVWLTASQANLLAQWGSVRNDRGRGDIIPCCMGTSISS